MNVVKVSITVWHDCGANEDVDVNDDAISPKQMDFNPQGALREPQLRSVKTIAGTLSR